MVHYKSRVTETNGNAENGIRGSRITVYGKDGEVIDRFSIPVRGARYYCAKYPNGVYGKRCTEAVNKMKAQLEKVEQNS